MNIAPLILITPSTQKQGVEFADASISLSNRYARAIIDAGGLPLVLPLESTPELVKEWVRRADGVVMTGGDDVQTKLYSPRLPKKIASLVKEVEPERDLLELELVEQIFQQRKPLLAICRGHQILNVALGGTLIVDIPSQVRTHINHRRMDAKTQPVHDIFVVAGSELARILGVKKIGVNSTHHQSVGSLSKLLKVTAQTSDGVVEAMELKNTAALPFLQSVQFHPERLYDRYPRFSGLFHAFVEACANR